MPVSGCRRQLRSCPSAFHYNVAKRQEGWELSTQSQERSRQTRTRDSLGRLISFSIQPYFGHAKFCYLVWCVCGGAVLMEGGGGGSGDGGGDNGDGDAW